MATVDSVEQEIHAIFTAEDANMTDTIRAITLSMGNWNDLSRQTRKEVGLMGSEIYKLNRAQFTIMNSWRASHPALALFTRGLSQLGNVARNVMNVINTVQLQQIAHAQNVRELHSAQAEEMNVLRQIAALQAEGVVDTDPQLVALRTRLEEIRANVKAAQDEIDAEKWKNLGIAITGAFSLAGSVGAAISGFLGVQKAIKLALEAETLAATKASIAHIGLWAARTGGIAIGIGLIAEGLSRGKSLLQEAGIPKEVLDQIGLGFEPEKSTSIGEATGKGTPTFDPLSLIGGLAGPIIKAIWDMFVSNKGLLQKYT